MAVQDLERIEQKIDRTVAGAVVISDSIGGVMFTNMAEVMEFAKLLSVAGSAVPKHLRANPGACLAVTVQALEWRMSPVAVANKSYEVNDRIAYESQLIHAVVEARAPLKQRLRCAYEGEGDKMVCVVTGHFKGEVDPVAYRSPEIGKITTKNSPLWKSDPQQQLWYYSVRAFARRYCPDVLLGIYSEDELAEIGPENARDITPATGIKERLKGKKGAQGFDHGHVERQLENKSASPETPAEPQLASPAAGGEPKPEAVAVRAEMQEPAQVLPEQAEETPLNPKWAEAQDVLAKLEQSIREVGDDELGDYKASGRRIIDGFEGLSDEERDALRGQFTGMVLGEQQRRAQEKKGRKK